MKTALTIASFAGLLLVALMPLLYLFEMVEKPLMIRWMLVGTIVWFATVPFWMGRRPRA